MSACARFWVSGRVQGVWFRAGTQQQAQALGLTGFASNLPDGRVEVLACGAAAAIDALEAWLWQGTPQAQVSDVVRSAADDCKAPHDFTTR